MNSIKLMGGALALSMAISSVSYAAEVSLPDVSAEIYGKLNYHAYYNENTSGTATWKSGNNASRIGISISEGGDIKAVGKIEVGVNIDDSGSDTFSSRLAYLE